MFNLKALALTAWAAVAAANTLQGNCPIGDDDLKQFGNRLSSTAKIYFPGSSGFTNATTRWSALEEPKVNVVVVPGTENDVAETVSKGYTSAELELENNELARIIY